VKHWGVNPEIRFHRGALKAGTMNWLMERRFRALLLALAALLVVSISGFRP
jgi:hypothetical protein